MLINQGFHKDWKKLENKNSHGEVLKYWQKKNHGIVINHGILPILSPKFTKFKFILLTLRNWPLTEKELTDYFSDYSLKML